MSHQVCHQLCRASTGQHARNPCTPFGFRGDLPFGWHGVRAGTAGTMVGLFSAGKLTVNFLVHGHNSYLVTDLCAEHEWCEAELAQCREAASQLAERVTEAQETHGKAERWLKPLQAALQPLVEASQRAAVQLSQAASLAGSVELVTLAKFQGGQARLEINYLNFVKLIKISLN